jgi:salicylate hydroxylase
MVGRCRELGVEVRLNAKVRAVDVDQATVKMEDGSQLQGDVVLCADGLWSSLRSQFLGKPSPAVLTGDLAFRIVLHVDDLSGPHRDELAKFIAGSTVNFWAGPYSHVVSYTMRAGTVLNLVLLCPDNLPESVVKAEGDTEEMKKLFEGWDPLLQKLLGQVQNVHKWKLMWLEGLPEWANTSGTFFMAGDCCHPMLPYLAQGANSSLEDGAVLGYLLGKVRAVSKMEQLPKVSALYQKLRMERGRQIQLDSFRQRDDFHLPDGPAQEARDALMLDMLGRELKADFPSRWTCPRIQRYLYGYDAYKEAECMYEGNPF